MEDLNQIKNALGFIDKVIDQELESAEEILSFIPKFTERYVSEKTKLPYHVNLIDELRANENAHSRIFEKLLQQETPCGKFEILESFVQFLSGKSASFSNICLEKAPDITQEVGRIDLWIRDKDKRYAIIIENKIHRARDTKEQLSNYIEKTINDRFDIKNIYVIYLSDNAPENQTWGKYKKEFEPRFLHLSFREDILTWLADYVLPNVRLKDKYLYSALEQYIDHLEGMYDKRNINQKMNMKLQELIKREWELNDKTPQEKIDELIEKQQTIKNIDNQIDLLINEYVNEYIPILLQKWSTYIEKNYPDYEKNQHKDGLGLMIDMYVEVKITISNSYKCIWCEVRSTVEGRELPPEIVEKVRYLVGETIYPVTDRWHHRMVKTLSRFAYKEAYALFCDVIEVLTDRKMA